MTASLDFKINPIRIISNIHHKMIILEMFQRQMMRSMFLKKSKQAKMSFRHFDGIFYAYPDEENRTCEEVASHIVKMKR